MDIKEKIIAAGEEVADLFDAITSQTTKLANKAVDKHVCIGVTGFSGSGKSTFITSLIHQLKFSNEAMLGGFSPARDDKIIEINLLPIPGLKLFDYDAGIDALSSDPPKWPEPTSSLSGCILEIVYKRDSFIKSVIGEQTTLRVEIRDYPGEWLLDLPLLGLDYPSWCIDITETFQLTERKELIGELLDDLKAISPFDVLTETQINDLYERYKAFLVACKEANMTLLQPGHVLLPAENDSFEAFFPLMNIRNYSAKELKNADKSSIYKVLLGRYKEYLKSVVNPFFIDYFKSVDRQVVLIDSLKALSNGANNFEDMMVAFSRIIDCYSYGENGFLRRLIAPNIERILFLSSKPDRVLSNQHENLRQFTDNIIQRICKQSIRNTIDIQTEIVCAVRCTKDMNTHLVGSSLDGEVAEILHPEIPEKIPTKEEWSNFENWKPIELQPALNTGLKHGSRLECIRMDMVLKNLIGDKF
ncbi:MAG: YcjX family protein [Cycloclasticus sp.]|nr:YcjX family protein [Cycloclasticus sp.]